MVKKRTEETSTHRVFQTMLGVDDFVTGRDLQRLTGLNTNRVSAALYSLLKYKAVQSMESDGKLWWFATPQEDTRSRTVEERVPEIKARKPRKPKVKNAL